MPLHWSSVALWTCRWCVTRKDRKWNRVMTTSVGNQGLFSNGFKREAFSADLPNKSTIHPCRWGPLKSFMDPGNNCREAVHLQSITHLRQWKCYCSCSCWDLMAHTQASKACAYPVTAAVSSFSRGKVVNGLSELSVCDYVASGTSKEQANQASRSNLNQCCYEQTSSRADLMYSLEPGPYSEHIHIVGTKWYPRMSFNPWVVLVFLLRRTWCECIVDVQGDAAFAQHLRWADCRVDIPFS